MSTSSRDYSPTRELALELDAAGRHLDALADNTARQQKFLDEFDIDPDFPLPDESEDPLSNADRMRHYLHLRKCPPWI